MTRSRKRSTGRCSGSSRLWPPSTPGLRPVGIRLALKGHRVIVVGRLERTELESRLTLERLTADELDPKLAAFPWEALGCTTALCSRASLTTALR